MSVSGKTASVCTVSIIVCLKIFRAWAESGLSYKLSSSSAFYYILFFFKSLRDRLIEQLTAELQALKEELESFRLEVSEIEKGKERCERV